MRDGGQRHIPCASVLVRLVKAPLDSQARLLRADKVPHRDWKKLGLFQVRPRYSDRAYYSMRCKPTPGEVRMFQTMVQRPPVKVSSDVEKISGKKCKSDKRIEEYIKVRKPKLQTG